MPPPGRSAELHLRHITTSGDPFERGSARPLDFGHWAAHKLESLSRHRLRHGEAVAIGLALDTLYSREAGLLPAEDAGRVCRVLRALHLPLWDEALLVSRSDGRRLILNGLSEFREHLGGELTITLLSGIGRSLEVHHLDVNAILRAIDSLGQEAAR